MSKVGWTAGVLRGLLALVLFAILALGYRAATGRTDRPPWWGVLAATVVVAVVLWLVQEPVERLANRVVHRQRADAEASMDALLRSMADALPVDEVVVRLAEAAGRNRQRAEVRVWLADGSSWGQAWPSGQTADTVAYRVDVRHGEDRVGEIEIAAGAEPLTPFDRRLLDELAAPAGVALSTVRLTVDLRRREAELMQLGEALAASTTRLREARAEQRHRLRAEVEHRVSPHLVAATDELAADRPDPAIVRQEASRALDELRVLARGIHPPRLSEDGLVASLDGWMERHDRLLRITGAAGEAVPDQVLRAAYFCVVTLLDTLVDAGAEELQLGLSDDDAVLQLQVGGRIAAPAQPDPSAVRLVRDRLEAFDGSLTSSLTHDMMTFTVRLPRTPNPERPAP
ncbi:sensor histidine kinase [Microlunatus ginsengisoli]|uniref:Histidine kinase n=1 Tax=Microlunatus ginsengisoli TaxID=363863 RepID=A0ABP6ZUJ8_9ACTN